MLVLECDNRTLSLRRVDEQPRQLLVEHGLRARLSVAPVPRSAETFKTFLVIK